MRGNLKIAGLLGLVLVGAKLWRSQDPGIIKLRLIALALLGQLGARALQRLRALLNGTPLPPSSPKDVTPAWLTFVLRSRGVLRPTARIESIAVHEFDAGKTSKSGRLSLRYADPSAAAAGGAPASMVLKMTRSDFEGRALNIIFKLYREGLFYSALAPEAPPEMPVPACYFSEVNWCSDFVILMEDIAPSQMLNTLDMMRPKFEALDNSFTTDLADVERCCAMVRAQHCKYLNDERLLGMPFLFFAEHTRTRGVDMSEPNLMHSFFRELWAKTKAEQAKGKWLGAPWTPEFVRMLDDSLGASEQMFEDLGKWPSTSGMPFTLVHNDFHTMNILRRGSAGGDGPLVVLDFQVVGIGLPENDVAYLLIGALSPEDRRANERRIVREHWEALVEAGLDPAAYPLELSWLMYKMLGALKMIYIVWILETLMADGRESDEFLVPAQTLRIRDFVLDHGTPAENWVKVRKFLKIA